MRNLLFLSIALFFSAKSFAYDFETNGYPTMSIDEVENSIETLKTKVRISYGTYVHADLSFDYLKFDASACNIEMKTSSVSFAKKFRKLKPVSAVDNMFKGSLKNFKSTSTFEYQAYHAGFTHLAAADIKSTSNHYTIKRGKRKLSNSINTDSFNINTEYNLSLTQAELFNEVMTNLAFYCANPEQI